MKIYESRPRVPILQMNHPTATGMEILYDLDYENH